MRHGHRRDQIEWGAQWAVFTCFNLHPSAFGFIAKCP
jgi:hypothetical protein